MTILDQESRKARLLEGLSDVQRKAATHLDGPLVVFSGAGSGKTRIITTRIAYLIESGVRPWEILAVTFTNKAAGEMRHRIEQMTPHGSRSLIATFHAACARWLREFAEELGFSSDFTIYDEDDSLAAIKTVLKEMNIQTEGRTTATEYRHAIGSIKTAALFPYEGAQIMERFSGLVPNDAVQVYKRYQEYLASCNAMDFGDLIMNVLLLLRNNVRVREVLQKRFHYILVDEYQDTNRSQSELLHILAEKHGNLFVVGDDDQAIYSWRGANAANILGFEDLYPAAKRVTMDQNYRCTGTIVNAASAMIANNRTRADKTLWTKNPSGDKISYRIEVDGEVEAWWVARNILDEGSEFATKDIAVFYRTNSQSRTLEEALRRERIPYRIYGTVRFYDRLEVKDLMAYLRLVVNPADDVSLKRVINVPTRGIGAVALEAIELDAKRRGVPILKAIEEICAAGPSKAAAKMRKFLDVIERLRTTLKDAPLDEVIEELLDATGYSTYIDKKFPDQAQDKNENILELGAALADFERQSPRAGLSEWLASVTLSSSEEGEEGGVSLMTLHSAKGLEFPRVYIVGLEEGLLPHRSSMEDTEDVEEERRLFYVGMTRAKKRLSLLSAFKRRMYTTWVANRPSRFLHEIPAEHLAVESDSTHLAGASSFADPLMASANYNAPTYHYDDGEHGPQNVKVGAQVRHPTYGRGVVEEVVNEFGALKAIVLFGDVGRRKVASHHLSGSSSLGLDFE